MVTLIGKKSCSTCREIEKLLKGKGIAYDYREITQDIPTAQELKLWHDQADLSSLKKMMNTSGEKYRQENYKDQLADLAPMQQLELIAQDGMLIKRPILLWDKDRVLIGPDVKKFVEALNKEDGHGDN